MAGLGDLLGGYGSEDDEDQHMEEGEASDPNATGAVRILQPTSSAASGQSLDADAAQLDRQPPHVLAGPAANPEPPPEGLSPPVHRSEDDDGEDQGPAAELRSAAAHILPAELREPPPGDPHPDLVAKVTRFLEIKHSTGRTVMDAMRGMREWNNPDFLEKMVDHFSLQPYGSCFPPTTWDPSALPTEDTWAQLSATLRQLEEKRREERARRAAAPPTAGGGLPFAHGGLQMPALMAAGLQPGAAAAAAAAPHAPKGPGLPRGGPAAAAALDPARAAALAQAAAKAQQVAAAMHKGGGSKWDAPKK